MKRFIYLILFLFSTNAYAGTVSFDQLALSSDLTVAKYNADLNRIYQDHNSNIQSSNIANDTVAEADMADDANPRIRTYEGAACEKVVSGLLTLTTSGTLVGSVPSGTAYPLGYRVVKSSSTPKTFTASKWTFVDLDINGDFTYSEVTIGGSTPAVATNSIRLSRVSTDGTQVSDVQDLRTTSCANGPFSNIGSSTGEANLDDVLKNGQPVRRFSLAGRTPQGFAQGLQVSYDTHTTFKVTSGSAYINGDYRSISTDTTVTTSADDPLNGVSGLDTGTVTGGPVRYYVYAVADQDAVKPPSFTYSTSSSAPSGVTNYRLIGSINTDATNLFTSRDISVAHGITGREIAGGWVHFNGAGAATIRDSYNVSGVAYNSTGNYTVSWDVDFNNAFPTVVAGGSAADGNLNVALVDSVAAGSVVIETINQSDVNEDQDVVTVLAFGDTRR